MSDQLRRAFVALVALSVLFSSGCGAILFKNPVTVRVSANVPAVVSVEAEGKGAPTPGELTLDRSKDHLLVVVPKDPKDGQAQRIPLKSHASWWRIAVSVILNGAAGLPTLFILTPILCGVDADAGAWQALDPGSLDIDFGAGGATPTTEVPSSRPAVAGSSAKQHFCGSCGKPVADGTTFCASCGARQ